VPPVPSPPGGDRSRRRALCLLLAAVTIALYLPVRDHEFVHYDDDVYVTGNPHVRTGLSVENLRWALSTTYGSYRHPVTWLSHQADVSLFGLDPGAHHLVSVLLHAVNAVLLLLLLARLTGRLGPSAFVAGLFALHPLHVESVAWVAERKDVLSTLFALLALLAYARYAERPSPGRYLVTLSLFALGLLAKPMLVTLPVLMLLLDHWPLGRLGSRPALGRALLEKAPFLALSAVAGVLTILASAEHGVTVPAEAWPLASRLDNATGSCLAYLGKAAWPEGLAVFYPLPTGDVSAARLALRAAALLGLTGLLAWGGRKRPYLIVGWLWYLVALAPVVGVVQVGAQAMADRYTYVSLIGVFAIVAFGGADLVRRLGWPLAVPATLVAAALVACAVAAHRQLAHWKDGLALFGHALEVTGDNGFMLMKYGTELYERGRPGESLAYFERSLALLPDAPDTYVNFANALTAVGRLDEAIPHYEIALTLDRRSVHAHYNLGVALEAKGRRERAIHHYEAAVRLDPEHERALANVGLLYLAAGKPGLALDRLERALRLDPEDLVARRPYASALAEVGRASEAIDQYRRVLAVRPQDAWAHANLGILLEAQGRMEQAAEHYRKALEADPGFGEARERLEAITR
jgi:tetratricopeptide (TPR) repeat protein